LSGTPATGRNIDSVVYRYDPNGNVAGITKQNVSGQSPPEEAWNSDIDYDSFFNMASKVASRTTVLIGPGPKAGRMEFSYGGSMDERTCDRYYDTDTHMVEKCYYRGAGVFPLAARRGEANYRSASATTGKQEFIIGATGIIAVVDSAQSDSSNASNIYYILKNHLGSTTVVMNQNGTVKDVYAYTPVGTPRKIYRDNGVSGLIDELVTQEQTMNYLFQGHQNDWQTGLHNFRARFYFPLSMRFFSVAPSSYLANANDPVNFVDQTGRDD
jgi:RHS repeat-associated protein